MLAFEVGGVPTTSAIGSDPANLWWQADHKQGKKFPNNELHLVVTLVLSPKVQSLCSRWLIRRETPEELRQICIAWLVSRHHTPLFLKGSVDSAAGSDISCLSGTPFSATTILPNVTDALTTCQPWGLTISGGQRPYTVVLSQVASHTITVVTMDQADDLLTYVNRATPGQPFMG